MAKASQRSRRPGSTKNDIVMNDEDPKTSSLKQLKEDLLRVTEKKPTESPRTNNFKRKQSFEVLADQENAIDMQLRSLENVTRMFQNTMYKNDSTTSAKQMLEHEIIKARRTLSQSTEQHNAITFDEVESETSRKVKLAIQKIDETRETISKPLHTPSSSYMDFANQSQETSEPSETGGFSVSEVDIEEFRIEQEENDKLLKSLQQSVERLQAI